MTESVEDGTEGGYTVGEIPAEQLEKMREQRPEMFIVTDRTMTEQLDAAYVEALIEKYGDVAELCSTTEEDDPDAPDYSEIDPEFYGYHPE